MVALFFSKHLFILSCYRFKVLRDVRFLHCSKCHLRKKEIKGKVSLKIKNEFQFKNFFIEQNKIADEPTTYVSDDLMSISNENKRTLKHFELGYRGELVFGLYPVYLALMHQKRCLYQLYMKEDVPQDYGNAKFGIRDEILRLADSRKVEVTFVRSRELNCLVPGAVHQGVCLDASPYSLMPYEENTDEPVPDDHKLLWLVLNEIVDPMNVGAVLRSAYYFGVAKIFMVANNSCRLSPTVSKASAGALEVLNIYGIENLIDFLQVKKKNGWDVISTACYNKSISNQVDVLNLKDFQLISPSILILGNEGKGLGQSVQLVCNKILSIYPSCLLHKGIDSLNVSVATGILLHHLLGDRKLDS